MNNTKTILIAAMIAGTLDAIAAILIYAKPPDLHNISLIFRHISSGLFGKQAYLTGPFYPFTGVVLHYLIATIWSAIYFVFVFPVFKPGSVWAKTILFACLIWISMNGLVVALSGLMTRYDGKAILRSYTIILFCVALPISFLAEKKLADSKPKSAGRRKDKGK